MLYWVTRKVVKMTKIQVMYRRQQKEQKNKRPTDQQRPTKEKEGRNINAVGESPEGTKSQTWDQSGANGEACRSIPTDHQPDRKRRLFPIGNTCPEAGTDLSGSGGGYIQLFGG